MDICPIIFYNLRELFNQDLQIPFLLKARCKCCNFFSCIQTTVVICDIKLTSSAIVSQ
jgi:hypothetical protein